MVGHGLFIETPILRSIADTQGNRFQLYSSMDPNPSPSPESHECGEYPEDRQSHWHPGLGKRKYTAE